MTEEAPGSGAEPVLSVIVAVRDVEDWITETLWSITRQTFGSIEVLVIDDGSSDQTIDLVESIARADPRVRLVRNPGVGGASARNFGVTLAQGRYLVFADGDDVVPSRAYERLVASAIATGAEMVVGNHLVMEPERTTERNQSLRIYGDRGVITIRDEPRFLRDRVCWNRIIARSAWNQLGLEFAESKRSNDILAMTQAYCALPFAVVAEPVYAYRRRVGTGSMTSAKSKPDSLVEHFRQEIACCDAVRGLGDLEVLRAYFSGILDFDVWEHAKPLFDPEYLDDERYDQVREVLLELLARCPFEFGLLVRPRLAAAYRAAVRGDWQIAGALGARTHAQSRAHLSAASGPGFRDRFRRSGLSDDLLGQTIRASALDQLRSEAVAAMSPQDFDAVFAQIRRIPGAWDPRVVGVGAAYRYWVATTTVPSLRQRRLQRLDRDSIPARGKRLLGAAKRRVNGSVRSRSQSA